MVFRGCILTFRDAVGGVVDKQVNARIQCTSLISMFISPVYILRDPYVSKESGEGHSSESSHRFRLNFNCLSQRWRDPTGSEIVHVSAPNCTRLIGGRHHWFVSKDASNHFKVLYLRRLHHLQIQNKKNRSYIRDTCLPICTYSYFAALLSCEWQERIELLLSERWMG